MAQLALSVAGATAGYFIGGPTGAQIGWAAGSTASSLLFPQRTRNEPPTVDTRVQISSYGVAIPQVWGIDQHAGNLIDWSEVRVVTTEETEGGKGGPQVTNVTKTYYADLMFLVCRGPEDGSGISAIRRIWRGADLFYDASSGQTLESIIAANQNAQGMTIYRGTSDQLPDPTLEALQGVGNVPAYRYRCCVMFQNLQLKTGRVQDEAFRFEVISASSAGAAKYTLTSFVHDGSFSRPIPSRFTDLNQIRFVTPNDAPSAAGGFNVMVGVPGGNMYRERTITPPWLVGGSEFPVHIHADVDCLAAPEHDGGYSINYVDIMLDDGLFLGRLSLGAGTDHTADFGTRVAKEGDYYALCDYATTKYYSRHIHAWQLLGTGTIANSLGEFDIASVLTVGTWYVTDVFIHGGKIYATCYSGNFGTPGTSYNKVLVIDLLTLAYEAQYDGPSFPSAAGDGSPTAMLHVSAGGIFVRYYVTFYKINTDNTFTLLYTGITSDFNDGSTWMTPFYVDDNLRYLIHGPDFNTSTDDYYYVNLAAVTPGVTYLSAPVADLCAQSGVTASEYDVTGIADIVLRGYSRNALGSARQSLDELLPLFSCTSFERDGKLIFRKLGGAAVASIVQDDLAAHEGGGELPDVLPIVRRDELQLAKSMTMRFKNIDQEYETGAQTFTRRVARSELARIESTDVILNDDEALRIAHIKLTREWIERMAYTWQTGMEYAALEPGDVVTLTAHDQTHTARVEKIEYADGLLKFEGVPETAEILDATPAAQSADPIASTVAYLGASYMALLDIAPLRETDDNFGRYVAGNGVLPSSWPGLAVYRASDSVNFQAVAELRTAGVIGLCSTTLGSFAMWNTVDEKNSVTVQVRAGTLTSSNNAGLLNQSNLCLIGSELLQFRDVTDNGNGSYTLKGLLRGRRGTDSYIATHAANEAFELITNSDGVQLVGDMPELRSDLNRELPYKAVTLGAVVNDAATVTSTNTGQRMRPLSPVNGTAIKLATGDWVFQWMRRDRLPWRVFLGGGVPMSESAETYELDIMSGATVKRTLNVSAALTTTYTAAQQTTDFGGAQSSVTANIYQTNTDYGRSIARQITG